MADTGLRDRPAAASRPGVADRPAARRVRVAGRAARRLVLRTAAIAAFLLLWQVAPSAGWVDRALIPPLSEVLAAWQGLAADGQLWSNTSASLQRALAGFALAVVVAVPLGLLIAWYRPVRDLLEPLLEVFRNTAALALLPVFTVLLGIGETSKIAIVVYACFFPVLLNTVSGVGSVDHLLVKSARSLGFGELRVFQKVVLPAALPAVFTGVRMAGASAVLVLIAAEMVGARAGLGYLVTYAQMNFLIPQMYAGILTISAIGLLVNAALVSIERRASRWRADLSS
ncbi:ABC transporter permease [Blastococcus sp. SYSU D00695]